MDDPLVIFDSGDEMVFTPEPSNIHFQIHRLSDAGGMTVSEDHYSILNELFGTPVSPDPVEDTFTSTLSTPKITLPEFLEDLTMEVDNGEVKHETVNTNRETLNPSPKPRTPSRSTACPTDFLDNAEEMGSKNVFETLFSDQLTPAPESLHEFPKDDLTESESEDDQLCSSPKPQTPSRPRQLSDKSEELERRNVPPKTIFCDQLTPDPEDVLTNSEKSDCSSSDSKDEVQIKHSQPLKRGISEEGGRKVTKNGVTEYDLSNIFTKSKTQNAFKSETKKKLGKKKVISRCISTHQSPRINKFVSKIKSNTQRHLTIKKFAEDHFSVFTENIFSKLDNLTTEIAVCHQNIKKLQESLDEFKLLKCKCKRRSNRHLEL